MKAPFLFAAGLLFAGAVQATEILPVHYSFDRATDVGTYAYHDETGTQLIDGAYGGNDWTSNFGNGPAYEWVGWANDTPVNIDFDFGVATGIDRVHVGSVQDNLDDVVLPDVRLYSSADGAFWNLVATALMPENIANNGLHHTYVFDGLGLSSRYMRVALSHNLNGPWTFTDEIDFYQNDVSIPEPGMPLLLLAGIAAFALTRRR